MERRMEQTPRGRGFVFALLLAGVLAVAGAFMLLSPRVIPYLAPQSAEQTIRDAHGLELHVVGFQDVLLERALTMLGPWLIALGVAVAIIAVILHRSARLVRLPEADGVAVALDRLAHMITDSDQRDFAPRLRHLAQRVEAEPATTARAVLGLFEGPESLDKMVLTQGGIAYKPPGPEREAAFRFARLRTEVYEAALALWHATKAPLLAGESAMGARAVKLADYGGGELWFAAGRFIARYDAGAHMSAWRDDRISRQDAEQAMLGPDHFGRMIIALQGRLEAAGVNPYEGSPSPLPEPPHTPG